MQKQSLPKQQRRETARLKLITAYERRARLQGYQWIAGVDEAGRGPLAGPVVAAACIIPEDVYIPGINDSKKLTAEQREVLYQKIRENPAILSGIGIVEAIIIDQINILQATFQAMVAAIAQLQQKPDYILIDGNQMPIRLKMELPCEGIVEGDSLSQSVMAAGILAKVTRDRIMLEHDKKWPEYGFKKHKGYGTEKHRESLKRLGPCPIHRMSFEPVQMAVK
ncbi:MAG TPA: ribonuclease HII [Rhabdochlamydiaceae bacterium]|nr:ribonuclease HII [Rhabdochlamydiaceae bacterium]